MTPKQQFELAYSLLRYDPDEDYHCNDYATKLYDLSRNPDDIRAIALQFVGAAIMSIRNVDCWDRYSFNGEFHREFRLKKRNARERIRKRKDQLFRDKMLNSVMISREEYARLKALDKR